jgi:CHAD domain-containing protein
MTSADAMKAFGHASVSQILGNWAALPGSDDPEVAHQLRVGLRRMRTTLRLFKTLVDGDSLRHLGHDVRDLGKVVGALRDADVVIGDIVEPVMREMGAGKNFESLLLHLEQERVRHRKQVREALADGRWTWLRLNCMLFGYAVDRALQHSSDDSRPDLKFLAAEALDRTWDRVARKGRGFEKHTQTQRHDMRKALKTLRYACDFLVPLYENKAAVEFTNRLKKLQDVFGYLNDVAMAEQLAGIANERADLKKAVATVLKWHRKHAKTASRDAGKRWRELKKSDRFWR